MAVFILNGILNEHKAKGVIIFDNFELSIKLNYLTLDEVDLCVVSKIQGHVNERKYKELFDFSNRLKCFTRPKLHRIVKNASRKPAQFITKHNVYNATSKSELKSLTIFHFKEALKEELEAYT